MIERTREQYPDVSVFATTLRQVVNANEHLWGAIMRTEDGWQVVEPRPIRVLDRIGGGDGFRCGPGDGWDTSPRSECAVPGYSSVGRAVRLQLPSLPTMLSLPTRSRSGVFGAVTQESRDKFSLSGAEAFMPSRLL